MTQQNVRIPKALTTMYVHPYDYCIAYVISFVNIWNAKKFVHKSSVAILPLRSTHKVISTHLLNNHTSFGKHFDGAHERRQVGSI